MMMWPEHAPPGITGSWLSALIVCLMQVRPVPREDLPRILPPLLSFVLVIVGWLGVPDSARGQYWQWTTEDTLTLKHTEIVPEEISYRAIASAGPLHCIAAGFSLNMSAINRTTDGGHMWKPVLVDTGYRNGRRAPIKFNDLAYPTPRLCIAVGDSGTILRSGDGGDTWERINCDARRSDGSTVNLVAVSMCDSLHGIAAGFNQVLLRTRDGGLTWQRDTVALTDVSPLLRISDVACLSATTSILALRGSSAYLMLRTEDAGATWAGVDADTAQALCFIDSLNGWGAGSGYGGQRHITNEIVINTTDGGRTWRTLVHRPAVTFIGFLAIAFADRLNGFVTAYDGRILRTTDGGVTWERTDSLVPRLNLHAPCIAYPSVGKAWAGTIAGQILRYTPEQAGYIRREEPKVFEGIGGSGIGRLGFDSSARVSGAPLLEDTDAGLRVMPTVAGEEVRVEFALAAPGDIVLDVVDMRGARALLLHSGPAHAGAQSVRASLSGLTVGAYLVRLRAGPHIHTARLVVMR